jgi:hypothetical protein
MFIAVIPSKGLPTVHQGQQIYVGFALCIFNECTAKIVNDVLGKLTNTPELWFELIQGSVELHLYDPANPVCFSLPLEIILRGLGVKTKLLEPVSVM